MYLVKLNAKNALQETEKANRQLYFFVSLPPEHAKSTTCDRPIHKELLNRHSMELQTKNPEHK